MEILKDLTDQLVKAKEKDRYYHIEGKIVRLLAPQHYTRPYTFKKDGWGTITRVETTQDGTPQDLRAPKRKRKVRTGEGEVKEASCWTFKIVDKHIMLPWGDHFGLVKKSLLRSIEAQRKLRYEEAPLALLQVFPNWLNIGEAPCESMKDGYNPEVVLETRHTQSGDVMVEVFFDYILNRKFSTVIKVDSEAPVNEEKFVAEIKTLNSLDTVGPSKRGKLEIDRISQVKLTEKDLKELGIVPNGTVEEAPAPIVY